MESLAIPALLTAAGAYFLVRNVIMLRDKAKLTSYIQTSPKAKLWVKKYGTERTIEMARKYFLPVGVVVSGAMLGVGAWSLFVLL